MRYHWGFAVGHIYSGQRSGLRDGSEVAQPHTNSETIIGADGTDEGIDQCQDMDILNDGHAIGSDAGIEDSLLECQETEILNDGHMIGSDAGLEEPLSETNGGQLDTDNSDSDSVGDDDYNDDVDVLAFDEMYGDSQNYEVYD